MLMSIYTIKLVCQMNVNHHINEGIYCISDRGSLLAIQPLFYFVHVFLSSKRILVQKSTVSPFIGIMKKFDGTAKNFSNIIPVGPMGRDTVEEPHFPLPFPFVSKVQSHVPTFSQPKVDKMWLTWPPTEWRVRQREFTTCDRKPDCNLFTFDLSREN